MSVQDIFQFSGTHMLAYLAPVLLVFGALAFADQMSESIIRLIRSAGKQFRI